MTLPIPLLKPFGAKILLVAFVGATLPVAHAAARNHDCQAVRIPAAPPAVHDRAPGPVVR